jgi:hypothetical protein
MTDLRRIASAMGGDVYGNTVAFPTPGHSNRDRGTVATLAPGAPDGLLVHSFNGGDPLAIKDELRAKGVLPGREQSGEAWRVSGVYEFTDESGAVLYRTRRHEHPSKPKRYTAERPDGHGGWIDKIGDARRVLYRLPELLAADPAEPVYLVEGERKADKLAAMGFPATAIAFGCKGWRKCYAEALAGRTVAVLPDNDEPGRAFAETARAAIEEVGGRAHLVELAGLPPAGDVIDWAGTADELRALTGAALTSEARPRGLAFRNGVSARALMQKLFDPIRWIIPGYVSEGMYVLAGAPKLGKSWLTLDWMVAVGTSGRAMGAINCEEGDVLGLMLEDNERRLQRRLRQMQLETVPDRLTLLTEWPTLDDGCLAEIEAWIAGVPNPRLIVVDVFARVKGSKGGKETDYDFDYRQAALLQSVASRHNLAVVVVHHTRKMAAEDPFDEVSGTRGLTGAADGVLVLKKDGERTVLYGRGRDLEEVETALQFDKEKGTWEELGAAWLVADTIERREIQQILGRSTDPMTPTEIAERVGKSRQNVQKMLAKMYDEGQVEKVTTGRYILVSPVSPVSTRETRETTPYTRGVEQ